MGVSAHWVKLSASQVHGFLNKQGRAALVRVPFRTRVRHRYWAVKVILPQLRFNRECTWPDKFTRSDRFVVRVPRNEKAPWMASPRACIRMGRVHIHTHQGDYRSGGEWRHAMHSLAPCGLLFVSAHLCILPHAADCCRRYYYMGLHNVRLHG